MRKPSLPESLTDSIFPGGSCPSRELPMERQDGPFSLAGSPSGGKLLGFQMISSGEDIEKDAQCLPPRSPKGRSGEASAARPEVSGEGGGGPSTRSRSAEMDLLVRRGPVARAYYLFMKFLSQLAGLVLFDIRGFGAYRVPAGGAVVVAPNHQSYLDPWLTGMCVRRPLFYLARDTLFRFPVLRSLLSNVNAIPIPRGKAASRSGIELGRAALRA